MNTLPVPICNSLLTPETSAALAGIGESITHSMRTRQLWRTETEMRVSVLDAVHFPTAAARYWQSVREQCVQVGELSRLFFDQRRNVVKRLRAQRALDAATDELDAEEASITIDECILTEQFQRQEAADRVREILLWEKLKAEQVAADPTFDRDDVDKHQLVSYTTQFILRAQHSDAAKMSGGELDNLLGQLRSGIARAQEKGVLKTVLAHVPPAAAKLVEKQLKHLAPPPARLN